MMAEELIVEVEVPKIEGSIRIWFAELIVTVPLWLVMEEPAIRRV